MVAVFGTAACTPSPPLTAGFYENTNIRNDVSVMRRSEVDHIVLDAPGFCDSYGETPVIYDRRLIDILYDALWRAEAIGEQVMNRGDNLYLYDTTRSKQVRIDMDYPSAPSYIGPAWRIAMSKVRYYYANQLKQRVQSWTGSDTLQIYYPGGASSPISPPPSKGAKSIGVPPYTGPLWSTKPNIVIRRPEEVAQIIALLSSSDISLYDFDTYESTKIRIDRIEKGSRISVYVVLPLKPDKTEFSSPLIDPGIKLYLLKRLSHEVLARRSANR